MAKKKSKAKDKEPDIELEPDAWGRFEKFIKKVTKAPPQHRPSKQPKGKSGE